MEEAIRILVVDDEPDIRRICRILLETGGYTVLEAATGAEAVEQVRQHPELDLILMDIQMPIMDGYEATKAIRNLDNKNAQIPIIALTANAFDEDRKKAIKAGMNGHIAKPIDVNVILQNLDRIFGKNGDEDTRAKEQ